MLDKIIRIENIVVKLSFALQIDEDIHEVVQDAASLAMSDLATAVVTEFTSLSGIMARHYAIRDGYSEQVVYFSFCSFVSGSHVSQFFFSLLQIVVLYSFHVLRIFNLHCDFFSALIVLLFSVYVFCVLQVAEALFEITLPRFSGDILPETDAGIVLAVADRWNSSHKFLYLFSSRLPNKCIKCILLDLFSAGGC